MSATAHALGRHVSPCFKDPPLTLFFLVINSRLMKVAMAQVWGLEEAAGGGWQTTKKFE